MTKLTWNTNFIELSGIIHLSRFNLTSHFCYHIFSAMSLTTLFTCYYLCILGFIPGFLDEKFDYIHKG